MVTALTQPWRALLALLACLPLMALAQQQSQNEVAFIELSASADEVYVHQQLRLTVKLYYTNQIIGGDLSEPKHPDAVINELHKQKQYRELIAGQRYRVIEREYVIFPQKPGRLQLPPLDFLGTAMDDRGVHYRIADSAVLFPVNVKDIPASFSGSTWLPATDVSLTASGLERTGLVKPGDNLARTLTLTAHGLLDTTLPELDIRYPDQIRSYPEPEQRESSAGADGVVGQLQQTTALVPVSDQGGEITLPEVRIPWWDVTEDREKVAILPARTIQLAPVPAATPTEQPRSAAESSREEQKQDDRETATTAEPGRWLWPILAALLVIGWATTGAAWWLHSRRPRAAPANTRVSASEKERFRALCDQANALDPAFFNGFPVWVRELTAQRCRTTDEALKILSQDQLTAGINRWRESLFRSAETVAPDGKELAGALKEARKQWYEGVSKGDRDRQSLPNLYPEGLNP